MVKFSSALIFIFLCAMFSSSKSNAQSAPVFGLGLIVGQGTTHAKGLALGADFRFQIRVNERLYIPITGGFTTIRHQEQVNVFSGKSYRYDSEKYIPLKTGIKYFFDTPSPGLYAMVEMGLDVYLQIPKGASALVSPAIGYTLRNGIDIAILYEGAARKNYAGIRVGYGF
jgi:hypothetical protein